MLEVSLRLTLHPKQIIAKNTKATEIFYAGAVPAVLVRVRRSTGTVPPALRRSTLRRGFEPLILAALVAPLQPWCAFLFQAYRDCLNCSCLPCTVLVDVTVYLLEKYLQPCCCRNKQRAGPQK